MKKLYYLGNCSTCIRIIKELGLGKEVVLQEMKTEKITPNQLDDMAKMAGSYEALFSRVAIKYRSLELNKQKLEEKDYRKYILEEYTFLKRPVLIYDKEIFIGNSKNTIAAAKSAIAAS
jgi:arsenate reductase